jgi:hypothetical protein
VSRNASTLYNSAYIFIRLPTDLLKPAFGWDIINIDDGMEFCFALARYIYLRIFVAISASGFCLFWISSAFIFWNYRSNCCFERFQLFIFSILWHGYSLHMLGFNGANDILFVESGDSTTI